MASEQLLTSRRFTVAQQAVTGLLVVGLAAAAAAWTANAFVAFRYAQGVDLKSFSPSLQIVSADLTTASPLMMVLTFAIPLVIIARRFAGRETPNVLANGYPNKWFAFVIYVGLAATLFGMILALGAVATDSDEDQSRQLTKLIAGTATALVSSLVALVAVFFAHVIRNAMLGAGLLIAKQRVSLEEEVRGLASVLSALRGEMQAIRDLVQADTQAIANAVAALQSGIARVEKTISEFGGLFTKMKEPIASLVEQLDQSRRLIESLPEAATAAVGFVGEQVASSVQTQSEMLEQLRTHAELLAGVETKLLEQLELCLDEQQAQSGELGRQTLHLEHVREFIRLNAVYTKMEHESAESERELERELRTRTSQVWRESVNGRRNGHIVLVDGAHQQGDGKDS